MLPGEQENNQLIITNKEYMCHFDNQELTEIHIHISHSHTPLFVVFFLLYNVVLVQKLSQKQDGHLF